MQERRKEPRKNLMAYTQVFDLYGGYLIGYLGDLTLKGAMVISEKPVEENLTLTLAIELPDLPDTNTTRMSLSARVVWSQQDLSPEYYNIGFEFNQVTTEQKKVIQAIIDNFEFRRDLPNYPIKPSPAK
jgi:c-di-GMP-binding flagellar brake protein YcgR